MIYRTIVEIYITSGRTLFTIKNVLSILMNIKNVFHKLLQTIFQRNGILFLLI
jgi:hypothetical protein